MCIFGGFPVVTMSVEKLPVVVAIFSAFGFGDNMVHF
jgi:hypothetical protein